MLVIARDTTHAAQLKALLESPQFFAGRYAGKVIQVDSSKSGKDEEEMVARLLAVESRDEPTEIVIHVNMLKEGWDVTNLYTIVPLPTRRQCAHAGGAEYWSRSTPALRQTHRGEGGGLAKYRRPRQVSGNHRRGEPGRFAAAPATGDSGRTRRQRQKGKRAGRARCGSATGTGSGGRCRACFQ